MDSRLEVKIDRLMADADENGWDVEWRPCIVDGCTEAAQVTGTRIDCHPDASAGIGFGFSICYGINERTNRMGALRLDGKPSAVVVLTADTEDGRVWYGPARAWLDAIRDPQAWTGRAAPDPEFASR